MSAGTPRFVKAFCALAIALSGAGAYLVYNGGKNRHANAPLVMLPRPSGPGSVEVNSHSPPHAASPTPATGDALSIPLVLPPASRRSTAPVSIDDATRRGLVAQCAEIASLGLPSDAEVRCYGGYIASLNYERKVPNWVLESVRGRRDRPKGQKKGAPTAAATSEEDTVSRSKSGFYADPTVPALFRVLPTEYDGARGLSRGHLAAAQLHKGSQVEMDATFNMNANIVPQDMTCNAVDWLRLESLVRRLSYEVAGAARRDGSDAADGEGRLLVVTGPAYLPRDIRVERRGPDGRVAEVPLPTPPAAPTLAHRRVVSYEVVGKAGVAVPTHLFKVILAETGKGSGAAAPSYEMAAFLMPNKAIAEERPLTDYQVSPEALEKVTGLRFFPGLPRSTASLPDLCRTHRCESKGSALFEKYRLVAKLRAADTIPELNGVYTALERSNSGVPLDDVVRNEYKRRMEELATEAVSPID